MYTCITIYIYTRIKPLNDSTSDKYKDKIITFTRRCRRRNFMEIIFKEKKKKEKEGKEKGQPNTPFVRTDFQTKISPQKVRK